MALIILNSGGGGGGGGGLANIPVTNADGSVNVPATSLKFFNSLVVANGNQAVITPNGGGGGSNTIIGIIDPTNTTQASAVGQLYYNSTTLQTFICTAIVSGVPATYTWNLITGITINIVAPTTTTPGFIGQLYVYNNNNVFSYYICVGNANNSYTWDEISGGGGGGGVAVKSNATQKVAVANILNFAGVGFSIEPDPDIANQANVIANPTNTAFFTFIIASTNGEFPLTYTLTDKTVSNPLPTNWLWTVVGGTINVDYAYRDGTTPTSQNPIIYFQNIKLYTLTLTPSNTDKSVAYTSYSISFPSLALPLIEGSFKIFSELSNTSRAVNKPYFNYLSTDTFSITVRLSYVLLQCLSISVSNVASNTIPPTFLIFTLTSDDINRGIRVNSPPIPQPIFPISYSAFVEANMNNSDLSNSIVSNSGNKMTYYVPAFWIQNQSLTAPTFDTTATQVEFNTYLAGQNILFNAGSDIQVVWVAFPVLPSPAPPLPALPQAFVVYKSDYSGTADLVSSTPSTQTIAGQIYKIYGYQIGYTGYPIYSARLYLETIINPIQGPVADSNIIVQAQVSATPKLGFFKRLFGAKS